MRGGSSKRGGWITIRCDRTAAWGIEPRQSSRRNSAGKKAVEKTLRGKVQTTFPLRLGIPQTRRDSHFPTASATAVSQSIFRTRPRALTHDWIKNGGQVRRLPFPESSKQYEELLVQRLSESQALENYLQTSNHMFVHLQVRSAKPRSGPAL